MRELRPTLVDLSAAVEEALRMLRRTMSARIAFRRTGEPAPWPVVLDPVQFQTAIVNLALNADDAMPDEGRLGIEIGNIVIGDDFVAQDIEIERPLCPAHRGGRRRGHDPLSSEREQSSPSSPPSRPARARGSDRQRCMATSALRHSPPADGVWTLLAGGQRAGRSGAPSHSARGGLIGAAPLRDGGAGRPSGRRNHFGHR